MAADRMVEQADILEDDARLTRLDGHREEALVMERASQMLRIQAKHFSSQGKRYHSKDSRSPARVEVPKVTERVAEIQADDTKWEQFFEKKVRQFRNGPAPKPEPQPEEESPYAASDPVERLQRDEDKWEKFFERTPKGQPTSGFYMGGVDMKRERVPRRKEIRPVRTHDGDDEDDEW